MINVSNSAPLIQFREKIHQMKGFSGWRNVKFYIFNEYNENPVSMCNKHYTYSQKYGQQGRMILKTRLGHKCGNVLQNREVQILFSKFLYLLIFPALKTWSHLYIFWNKLYNVHTVKQLLSTMIYNLFLKTENGWGILKISFPQNTSQYSIFAC